MVYKHTYCSKAFKNAIKLQRPQNMQKMTLLESCALETIIVQENVVSSILEKWSEPRKCIGIWALIINLQYYDVSTLNIIDCTSYKRCNKFFNKKKTVTFIRKIILKFKIQTLKKGFKVPMIDFIWKVFKITKKINLQVVKY